MCVCEAIVKQAKSWPKLIYPQTHTSTKWLREKNLGNVRKEGQQSFHRDLFTKMIITIPLLADWVEQVVYWERVWGSSLQVYTRPSNHHKHSFHQCSATVQIIWPIWSHRREGVGVYVSSKGPSNLAPFDQTLLAFKCVGFVLLKPPRYLVCACSVCVCLSTENHWGDNEWTFFWRLILVSRRWSESVKEREKEREERDDRFTLKVTQTNTKSQGQSLKPKVTCVFFLGDI